MIRYTTKDIVNRAAQLADLENSDFISWNENVNLLNECWQKIYQHLIDNGDKTFIKEFETVASNKIFLPKDFYELFSVELVPSCRQITRKAKSESDYSLTYDIENNVLTLYGTCPEKVRVKYFPLPQTLTLKANTKDINSDFNSIYSNLGTKTVEILDCYKNKYIYSEKDSSDNKVYLYIFNKETNEKKKFIVDEDDLTVDVSSAVIGARNDWVCSSYAEDGQAYKIYFCGKKGERNAVEVDADSFACLLKKDKEIGAVVVKGTVLTVYLNGEEREYDISERVNLDEIGEIKLDGKGIATCRVSDKDYISLLLPTFDGDKCDWIQLDLDTLSGSLSATKTEPYPLLEFGKRNECKRYSNLIEGKTFVTALDGLYEDNIPLFNFDDYDLIGVNEVNEDNGYGITVKDEYNTGHILSHGVFVDTLLLYPNNIFFNFMSMLMAISYKVKQNADITILTAKFNEMESQYFDTLSRDVNSVVRITNVY